MSLPSPLLPSPLISKDRQQNCNSRNVIPHGSHVPQSHSVSNMSPCCLTCNSTVHALACMFVSFRVVSRPYWDMFHFLSWVYMKSITVILVVRHSQSW